MLQPLKYDQVTGQPVVFRDDQTGRLYMLDQMGNPYEIDRNGNPMQQQQQQMQINQGYGHLQQRQQPNIPRYNNGGYNQNQSAGMVGLGNSIPRTDTSDLVGTNSPASYRGREQVKEPETVFNQPAKERPKVDESKSLINYEPEPGSELEPLIDTSVKHIDVIVNDDARTYKILTVNKG